jgi:ATP-dependent protease HslVU (ClpYQ) peptidase subunit
MSGGKPVTCIVGVADKGQVWIGGDSAGSNGWSVRVRSDTKVFRNGPYVLGFTTSFRMGQLLRYRLQAPEPDGWDIDRFMATAFVDAVRQCLKDGGWAKTDNGQEQGGTFLVGYRDRLYEIEADFQIGYSADSYAAVGSGYLVALGSLHATAGRPAEDRVNRALVAAEHFTGEVAGPFTVLATDEEVS